MPVSRRKVRQRLLLSCVALTAINVVLAVVEVYRLVHWMGS